MFLSLQIFRKEPFFHGHDNYDQVIKWAANCFSLPPVAFCTWYDVQLYITCELFFETMYLFLSFRVSKSSLQAVDS